MKFIGSLLNNLGFICLLICLVLLGAQYVRTSGADAVAVAGHEISAGAFNDFFDPVFSAENEIVRWIVANLLPCTIGCLVVTLLGGAIRKAAK